MTIGSLKVGDIIEVDKKGWRFHGLVREVRGRTVVIQPFEANVTWRTATSHEVVGIWKANRPTRVRLGLVTEAAHGA